MSASLVRVIDRVFDGGVLAFALWTLCAHLAVALGWGLDALGAMAVAAGTAALACGLVAARRRAVDRTPVEGCAPPAPLESAPEGTTQATETVGSRGLVIAGAGLCALGLALDLPLTAVWSLAGVTVAFCCLREILAFARPGTPAATARTDGPATTSALVVLALVCVSVALFAQRPDADDSFYLNVAVSAADDPRAPLLASDTLHRVADAPLVLPIYRLHSLELLQGGIARLTGRPVLDVAHLWLPALAGFFLPFVYARRMRPLTPKAWPVATAICIAFLLFAASASHGWANFGLLRLHQGKGLLLTLALPAVLAYALDFGRRGGARAWLMLAAAQIAAVGISASALWLAPVVAGTALMASVTSARPGDALKRLATGLAASSYVVAAALSMRADTVAAFRDAVIPSPEMSLSSGALAGQAVDAVFGSGPAGAFALFVAIGAWGFAQTRTASRLCAFTAGAAVLFWNPFFADAIAAQLTSAATYWRVLWLLPLPALTAIVFSAGLEGRHGRTAWAMAAVAPTLVFGALVALNPKSFALSPSNLVQLGPPRWKVPESEFDAARAIVAATGPQDLVLAPVRVAPWIPTFHQHPAAVVVRVEYLPVLAPVLGEAELERRMRLLRLVSGRTGGPRSLALLRSAILEDDLRVVALSRGALRWPELIALIGETGFQKIHQNADYQVWGRMPNAQTERP